MFRCALPLAALASVACLAAPAAQAGEEVWLSMENARRFPLMEGVAQVLIVNPHVADIEINSAREALLFGRTPGSTDVLFYNSKGAEIGQVRLRVRNPRDGVLTLYNGAERYSFSCTDRCEQVSMVGDSVRETAGLMGFGGRENQAAAKMAIRAQEPGGFSATPVEVRQEASAPAPAAPAQTGDPQS